MPIPSSHLPVKKRKVSHVVTVEVLEERLVEAIHTSDSLNPLADLISLASSLSDPKQLHEAIYALYRVFVLIIDSGRLCGNSKEKEEAKLVRSWLNDRLGEYTNILCQGMQNDQKAISTGALDISFSLLKHLSESFSKVTSQPQLHINHFRTIVNGILSTNFGDRKVNILSDYFVEAWLSVYDDIRWFFLRETAGILNSDQAKLNDGLAESILAILEKLTTMPTETSELNEFWIPSLATPPAKNLTATEQDECEVETEDDWRTFFNEPEKLETTPGKIGKGQSQRVYRLSTHQSLHYLTSHKAQFALCWMALLPYLSSSATLSSRALKFLHRGVIPHLNQPIRLMDWIGGCVDFGGSVGLLALNALFTLMQDHNLDYPNFYTRLYAFLTRDLLHLKHRSRFFRLTELFLSSSHLPATLLASFIKRLSRLSLSAPPAAIVTIIPFTYNILKRHPACMTMIHRDMHDFESDPFNVDEPSPYLTNALSSSLWELVSHRNHYHAPVATLARIFSDAFTKPGYTMEDFLDHTYGTLFDTESNRKIKRDPPMTLELKKGLFPSIQNHKKDDEEGESSIPVDIVSELWAF